VQARRSWNRPASVRRRVSCTASGRSKRRSTAGTPLRRAPNFWGALGAQIRGMGNATRYGEWRTQRGRSAG